MNKKGDYILGQETFTFLYKMLLVVIITVFIVIFVLAFFYRDYDVRQYEDSILAERIAACYIHNGVAMIENFDKPASEKCKINAIGDYYADINFSYGFPLEYPVVMEDGGGEQDDVRTFCGVFVGPGERPKGDYYEGCIENNFNFVLLYKNNFIVLSRAIMTSGVRNVEFLRDNLQVVENKPADYYFKLVSLEAGRVTYYKVDNGVWFKSQPFSSELAVENPGWRNNQLDGVWTPDSTISLNTLKSLPGEAFSLEAFPRQQYGVIAKNARITIEVGIKKRGE